MSLPAKELKGKSLRIPLKDYSNDVAYLRGGFASESVNGEHNFPAKSKVEDEQHDIRVNDVKAVEEEDRGNNDRALDLLFLLHSDISSLLRQIDELVVQAANLRTRGEDGTREIESFRSVLSDMLTLLKPWTPRLQKAISSASLQAENLEEGSLVSIKCPCTGKEELFEVESPEHTKFESLISPSPLVSWRADLDIHEDRQLFLLTPMAIGKSKSSKHQDLSKPTFERITLNAAIKHTLDIPEEIGEGVVGGEMTEVAAALGNTPGPVVALTKSNKVESALAFSPVFRKKAQSELLMTPCLKMSPPKSCALLEPDSASCCRGKQGASKSTCFPIENSNFSGSNVFAPSCSGTLGFQASKYPEILGIRNAPGNIKTDLESSPDWLFSPPKTCILLEPSDGRAGDKAVRDNREQFLGETKNVKDYGGGSLRMVESTPMCKEVENMMEKDRRAGESTLKRELWTRFEAASTHGLRYSSTAVSKKGFLEMLEEASGGEET